MNANTITTGKVRFSYCHLSTPTKAPGSDDERYSVSIIIPKSDKATLNAIQAAIDVAKENGKTSRWNGKLPAKLRTPLRDGDEERPDDAAYANSYFMNCRTRQRPKQYDENVQEIIDPTAIYSGCYGRVNITFFPYDTAGNRGVSVALNMVQKLTDGEPLGGGAPSAAEAFGGGLFD